MNTSEIPNKEQSKRVRLPHWVALTLNIVILVLGHVVVPWAYSLLTARHGWVDAHPGRWNVVGLSLVFIGLGGLFWCLVLHFAQAPQTVEITYIFPSVRSSWREMMSKLGVQGTNQVMLDAETEPATTYLMMEGPYKFSRHPMYLSVIILWFGWALFYGNIIVFVVWLITWLGITLFVAPPEEQALEARFGEAYREYKSRVPRWFGMPRG